MGAKQSGATKRVRVVSDEQMYPLTQCPFCTSSLERSEELQVCGNQGGEPDCNAVFFMGKEVR